MSSECETCQQEGLWKIDEGELVVPCGVCLHNLNYVWQGEKCYGFGNFQGMYYLLLLEEFAWKSVYTYSSLYEDPFSDNFGETSILEWASFYPEEIQNAILNCYQIMRTNEEEDLQSNAETDDESVDVILL